MKISKLFDLFIVNRIQFKFNSDFPCTVFPAALVWYIPADIFIFWRPTLTSISIKLPKIYMDLDKYKFAR